MIAGLLLRSSSTTSYGAIQKFRVGGTRPGIYPAHIHVRCLSPHETFSSRCLDFLDKDVPVESECGLARAVSLLRSCTFDVPVLLAENPSVKVLLVDQLPKEILGLRTVIVMWVDSPHLRYCFDRSGPSQERARCPKPRHR